MTKNRATVDLTMSSSFRLQELGEWNIFLFLKARINSLILLHYIGSRIVLEVGFYILEYIFSRNTSVTTIDNILKGYYFFGLEAKWHTFFWQVCTDPWVSTCSLCKELSNSKNDEGFRDFGSHFCPLWQRRKQWNPNWKSHPLQWRNHNQWLGVVFPHQNFFPWGMGKNGEGIIFSHGEMGKNGESYFGFKLTKKWYKIN